mmetsp:Transcript_12383/g.18893  ORF Transcript_12383/g.18893 Transcript_12383/m.18893 type:complete len:237 (+) Transcript_12383:306-1016(+)
MDTLNRHPYRKISPPGRNRHPIHGIQQCHTLHLPCVSCPSSSSSLPTLKPRHKTRGRSNILIQIGRNRQDSDVLFLHANLLQTSHHFFLDFFESLFLPPTHIHLVHYYHESLNTEAIGQQRARSSPTESRNTSLKCPHCGINDKDSCICHSHTSTHALDKISMTRDINKIKLQRGSLKTPSFAHNGDPPLSLLLQTIHDECQFRGRLSYLLCQPLIAINNMLGNCTRLNEKLSSEC